MKGKIYKNKLATNTKEHLNTDISSICNPLYSQSPQVPFTPNSNILSPQNYQKSPVNQNSVFRRTSQSKNVTPINQLFPESLINKDNNQINNILEKFKANEASTNNNSRLLKRVVSNPNLTSYQFLVSAQNKEDEDDRVDQNSALNNSSNSMFHMINQNSSKVTQKVSLNNNQIQNYLAQRSNNRPSSYFQNNKTSFNNSKKYLNVASPIYGTGTNEFSPSQMYDPLQETSNLMNFNRQNGRFNSVIGSDYIAAYEKRHKERISSLQTQHELQIQFFQEEIKSKDQIIEEMKKIMKEKQQIIKRLQSQNANLSSRSYISFANGNNSGQ